MSSIAVQRDGVAGVGHLGERTFGRTHQTTDRCDVQPGEDRADDFQKLCRLRFARQRRKRPQRPGELVGDRHLEYPRGAVGDLTEQCLQVQRPAQRGEHPVQHRGAVATAAEHRGQDGQPIGERLQPIENLLDPGQVGQLDQPAERCQRLAAELVDGGRVQPHLPDRCDRGAEVAEQCRRVQVGQRELPGLLDRGPGSGQCGVELGEVEGVDLRFEADHQAPHG